MSMRIIPAIDIIDGKCVRLTKGDYNQINIYNEDPLEVAKHFEANGMKNLHLVDLDGAKVDFIVNWKVLETICNKTNLNVQFGGGIKTEEALTIAFECGADQIIGGSIAVKDEFLFCRWIDKYGSKKIILGADVKEEKILVSGWLEETIIDVLEFIEKYLTKGITHIICTDINKDGLLAGSSIELYKKILEKFPKIKLIASGGINSINEVEKLKDTGVEGAIIGKAIYENKIKIKELLPYAN